MWNGCEMAIENRERAGIRAGGVGQYYMLCLRAVGNGRLRSGGRKQDRQ